MNQVEWRQELGELVRQAMRSPELEHYFRVKITKPGAQVLITQLGLFIHHRRDCWAHVSGNCPHMSVKQKILRHEYGEVIEDQYAEHGHMELIVRQGKALGLSPEEVLNVEPLTRTVRTPRQVCSDELVSHETPTNDQTRTPRLPDQDRTWVALGVQYKYSKVGTFELGYAHEFIRDANINNTVTGVPGALVGKFDNKADIISVQYSHQF